MGMKGELEARQPGQITEHPSGRVINIPAHVVRVFKDEQGRTSTVMVADFHESFEDAKFYVLARKAFESLADAIKEDF